MTERHRDVMFPSHKPPIRSFDRLSVAASAVSIVCVYVKAVRCSSIQIIRVERNSRATFYYLSTRCTEYIVYNSTKNTFCRTRRLSNATFSFWTSATWRSSSSKSAAVYKILSKSDDFSLRYGDITIFKMAVARHLGIVLPPHETTHEVSVGGRSCLSNFMSIWYTLHRSEELFEFFAYLAWNAYSGPQNGGFGGLKCDYSSSRPPKGTFLRKYVSFKLWTVKIRWGVWPVGELTESVTDTQTHTHR